MTMQCASECTEAEAHVAEAPTCSIYIHAATGLNVLTHCVECRTPIRPLLGQKARSRFCRVEFRHLPEGAKGYCACVGRRDHGRVSGKRRMVFKKGISSAEADMYGITAAEAGWEPAHGAITAYRSLKRRTTAASALIDQPSPKQPKWPLSPPQQGLGGYAAHRPRPQPYGEELHGDRRDDHAHLALARGGHALDATAAEYARLIEVTRRVEQQRQQHLYLARGGPPAGLAMPPMMHAPTLHQQPPRIERCFPDEALWDEKLQLNLMISNLPRDALIARLVVSIAFDNVTRCVTLLPLPRYARADECRFTTLDAKEQLFYDVIQFGGPPRCLDATLTLFFVQQLPVVTKQAALRFVSASAASAQLTDPNAHRHVPHAHAHGGHAQPGHAGHAPQTQGYHHAPPPPYDGSPPQHHAAFEDRAQTYPAHGHGAPAHGAAHGYGASYASSSFALHEQRGPYAQGRPPAFDDRAHAGRKHPLYKILAKGDGQRDHSQHSPPRSPPRSPQRDHAQRDQQRDQQRYHDHRESPSPSPSPSRVAEDEEDAPPPPKKKKAAELTDVAQSLVDLLRG